MKEAIVRPGPIVEIIESAIPTPGPNEVVTKVIVSGSNPKDWYGRLNFLIYFVLRR